MSLLVVLGTGAAFTYSIISMARCGGRMKRAACHLMQSWLVAFVHHHHHQQQQLYTCCLLSGTAGALLSGVLSGAAHECLKLAF
jgi:hypothetical protein